MDFAPDPLRLMSGIIDARVEEGVAGGPDLQKYEGLLVLPFAAGGWAIAQTTSDRGTSKWLIWAAVVVAMTTAAGTVFVYGVRR